MGLLCVLCAKLLVEGVFEQIIVILSNFSEIGSDKLQKR